MYRSRNKPVIDLGIYQEVVRISLGYAVIDGMVEVDFEPYKVRLPLEVLPVLEDLHVMTGDLVSILSTESGVRTRLLRRAMDRRSKSDHEEPCLTQARSRIQTAEEQEQVPNPQQMMRAPIT